MAIAFVQVQQTAPATGAGPFTVAITPTAGNFMIIGIGMNQKGIILSVTDNNGNVWTPVIFNMQEGNAGGALYYTSNCNGGATTITVTLQNAEALVGLVVSEYSGVANNHPIDGVATGFGSTGTSVSTGTLYTSRSNDVVVSFCAFIDQNISSIGGGYTLRSSLGTNAFTAMGDLAAPTAGPYTATWNSGVNTDYLLMACGLRSTFNPVPVPVPMQFSSTENATPSSPVTATFTNNVIAGNAIVAVAIGASTMTWTGVTDSEGNTYVPCVGANVAGCQMFVAFNVAGGTPAAVSASFVGTAGRSGLYIVEIKDVTNYDTGHGNSGTSATGTPGSFTLIQPNEIVVAVALGATQHALDPGGNDTAYYSLAQTTAGFFACLEYNSPATAAQNPAANFVASTAWQMVAGAFYTPQGTPPVPGLIPMVSAEW